VWAVADAGAVGGGAAAVVVAVGFGFGSCGFGASPAPAVTAMSDAAPRAAIGIAEPSGIRVRMESPLRVVRRAYPGSLAYSKSVAGSCILVRNAARRGVRVNRLVLLAVAAAVTGVLVAALWTDDPSFEGRAAAVSAVAHATFSFGLWGWLVRA